LIKNVQIHASRRGIRLDAAVLEAFPSASRAFVKDALSRGDIVVNGKRASKGLKLSGGETILIKELLEKSDNLVLPEKGKNIKPIYEDEFILAFDKPCNMPVQPLSCKETGTLMNSVVASYPECRSIVEKDESGNAKNTLMAGALHRIDADTSGLVIVSRTQEAFDFIRSQFTEQSVVKTYIALVEGVVEKEGVIEGNLIHDPTVPFCRMADLKSCRIHPSLVAKAKPLFAVTAYKPINSWRVENEDLTLLEVTIKTGVTHQIRAQLSSERMHIVNDTLYGAFAVEGLSGHRLHSLAAQFIHPSTGERIKISTPMPEWATPKG
jgi:23S rRNA pseudouridine1911/1915/1917 synthase